MQPTNPFVLFTSPDLAASSRFRQVYRRNQNVSKMWFVLNNERHIALSFSRGYLMVVGNEALETDSEILHAYSM